MQDSSMNSAPLQLPKWLRDLVQLLGIRAQFVLTGNIRDQVLLGAPDRLMSPLDALWLALEPLGYRGLLVWDKVDGLRAVPPDATRQRELGAIAGVDLTQPQPMQLGSLATLLRRVNAPTDRNSPPVVLVIDYASRLNAEGQSQDDARDLFLAAEKAAIEARPLLRRSADGTVGTQLFNPVIWLANRPNDLPYWLTVDSERFRSIPIPLPDTDTRHRVATVNWPGVLLKGDTKPESFARELANLTHNMSLIALRDIVSLSNRHGIEASEVAQAVQSFRVGDLSLQSPWRGSQLRERIREAERSGLIAQRVKGQPQAVLKVLDILKRTSIGLTGAQAPSSSSRPRGVLFFAGPTGVGKTEMAKTIAEVVFGDPSAFLRFDMSEFSAEQSGDRLIGAPPGYVGFDQGGELTNAIRERPFRVVLFDEIEKAHYRILDKFLQVLEDGRLTDGRGETVFFSDTLIVFTSNLGISDEQPDGTVQILVSPDTPAEEFEQRLLAGIRKHFVRRLQRPELLNRIGENVVVFHYIQPIVGSQILDGMLDHVRQRILDEHDVRLVLSEQVMVKLRELCVGNRLDNGGRGIGSKVEAVFVNPLARAIFDKGVSPGSSLVISDLRDREGGFELVID